MKLKTEIANRICGSKFFPLTFAIMAFLIILFYSEATSPIYEIEFGDSAVYKMMGHILLNGGVPYVDYFDHKGPYLYLINAIGECLSPTWGLLSLQVVSLFLVMELWFRIARLFVSPATAFFVLLLSILCFLDYYEYGNLTEEWSLLPSSLSLYLSLSYLTKNSNSPHEKWRSLVYGLCFGLMFFIRPNDAVIQCGGIMTGIFFYILLWQKQYSHALLNALAFILGFVIMATPWIVFFACHHALEDFYFGLIGFNTSYIDHVTTPDATYSGVTKKLLYICIIPLLLLFEENKKELFWLLIPISSLVLLFFGRNDYPHYYMTLIPVGYLVLFSLLFCFKLKTITLIGILLMMLTQYQHLGVSRGKTYIERVVHNSDIDQPTIYEGCCLEYKGDKGEKLFAIIPKEERDSVWNYGDTFSALFYHCDIIAQNPIPPVIASQKGNFPEERQVTLDISQKKPLWIFTKSFSPYFSPADSLFIAEHYYVAKKGDTSPYILLKRKK